MALSRFHLPCHYVVVLGQDEREQNETEETIDQSSSIRSRFVLMPHCGGTATSSLIELDRIIIRPVLSSHSRSILFKSVMGGLPISALPIGPIEGASVESG